MKKKVATAAIAAMTMTFLAGCSSRGTYAKYLTLGEYKGLNVTKVKTEVTDDDVEAEIESALDENAEYTDVDRAAKDGDQVNIDFDGSIDGEAWDSDTIILVFQALLQSLVHLCSLKIPDIPVKAVQ